MAPRFKAAKRIELGRIIALCMLTLCGDSPSLAGQVRTGCDAVTNFAEVVADQSAIVSLVRRIGMQECIFFIAPSPLAAPDDAVSLTTKYANILRDTDPDEIETSIEEIDFEKLLIKALLKPLKDERVRSRSSDLTEALSRTIVENGETLRRCSVEAFKGKIKIGKVHEGLFCGLSETGRLFIVKASSRSLSVELNIPLT